MRPFFGFPFFSFSSSLEKGKKGETAGASATSDARALLSLDDLFGSVI